MSEFLHYIFENKSSVPNKLAQKIIDLIFDFFLSCIRIIILKYLTTQNF